MAFSRSSLQEITDRITSDFEGSIDGASSLLRRSVLKIMARVFAGAVHLLYGYLDYQARQTFVTTADLENLALLASEYGLVRRAPIAARGAGTASGTAGTVIPAASELVSEDGFIYRTDKEYTIGSGGYVEIAFVAALTGVDSNDDAGITLTFSPAIVGVNSTVTVGSLGVYGGLDEETDDELRERVLFRKQYPPHGGCASDYVRWASEVPGVTRAWVVSGELIEPGKVTLFFVRDNDPTSIIPNSVQIQEVYDYLLEHVDPATGMTVGMPVAAVPGFSVLAPTPLSVNFTVLVYPNTDAVRVAGEAELKDLLYRNGGPGNTIYLSQASEAISIVSGEDRHRITVPTADVVAAEDEVHIMGTVTWMSY